MLARLAFLLFALLGLAVAGILSAEHLSLRVGGGFCAEGGGCAAVLASRYAYLAGVPLAYWGVLFYSASIGAGLWSLSSGGQRSTLMALGGVGATASAGFVAIQILAIRAICPLCMTSAACTVGMLVSAVGAWRGGDTTARPRLVATLAAIAIPLAGAVAMVGLLLSDPSGSTGDQELLGRFDGRDIRLRDLRQDDPDAEQQLLDLGYRTRLQYLDRKFAGLAIQAEASRLGISRDELIRREVDAKVDAARADIEARAEPLSPDDPERARQIADNMLEEVRQAALQEWIAGLVAKHKTEVLIKPPLGRRVTLDPALQAQGHREGPATTPPGQAPLELVVFSDLQCPICAELDDVLTELRRRHPDTLAVTYRHFPLSGHEYAEQAAVVGDAVARAGKSFAEYKQSIYSHRGNIDPDKIAAAAIAAGLTLEQVRQAREDSDLLDRVRASATEARRLRFGGAPVLVLNSRAIGGFFPLETLDQKLKDALDRQQEWREGR
jgi:protein-disulfide isomerase/uncharacterized membrane protein